MAAALFRRDWVNQMLRVAEAIEDLGPIRAGFSVDHGFLLDGRYGVAPLEIIEEAERARRVRKAARQAGGRRAVS